MYQDMLRYMAGCAISTTAIYTSMDLKYMSRHAKKKKMVVFNPVSEGVHHWLSPVN